MNVVDKTQEVFYISFFAEAARQEVFRIKFVTKKCLASIRHFIPTTPRH